MPVYDIYSKRKRRAEQSEPDVYQYEDIPQGLRYQILHIWDDVVGLGDHEAWQFIRAALCREKGRFQLAGEGHAARDCMEFLRAEPDVDEWLDLVEFSFRHIPKAVALMPASEQAARELTQTPVEAIAELNVRFREAGVGYQFENGQIIRVDSEFVHSEVVKPSLSLLSDPRFAGAQEEFLSAHAHYRAGEHKDAITDALNAFESTMKAICDIQGWEYPRGARAADLIKIIRANGLLPDYLDGSFDQLIATLKSGLPKVRNEEGGHGQGAEPRETPAYVAAYALHLAAAKIVLLIEALKETERRQGGAGR